MAKSKQTTTELPQTVIDSPQIDEHSPALVEAVAQQAGNAYSADPAADAGQASESRTPINTPDPRPIMSIALGDTKGSPRIQLLRSHRYKQMQLRFDQQPDDKYLVMLNEAGWRDRTEEEGIWTKQVESGMWQPVADAERLFKEIGNGIRKDKGLNPVMELSAA